MEQWDELLRELADDSSDYVREAGTVVFTRQGVEHALELREVPVHGLSVRVDGDEQQYTPIDTFVQHQLLGLPRLAKQILKALERSAKDRPQFVESSAEAQIGKKTIHWPAVSKALAEILQESEPGTTRLLQLMAQAGQGKTVLLEETAANFARAYQPAPHPIPILLPVDLLGRYVGTIDDAIAGSLNNTYVFPGLTQRDVALCVRRRWLVLALDGFDELVARVGARDAFLRITELLDQLRDAGTVVISARESFFELYQITSAIRSYLQPKTGSYSTITSRLLPWTHQQGIQVFTNLGSRQPDKDLAELTAAFEGDEQIVLHPFFLTRLADLWQTGERFVDAHQQHDRLARTKYVIEKFIARESREKWITRDGTPLLSAAEHTVVLGVVAEEMWRSGAFRLTVDELRVAAEIGLSEAKIAGDRVEEVVKRIPTHAALTSRERGVSFLHDRFLHYFLGCHLATVLARRDRPPLEQALTPREFSPTLVEWIQWKWKQIGNDAADVVSFLNEFGSGAAETMIASNTAMLVAALLRDHKGKTTVTKKTFIGNALIRGAYSDVSFKECNFWNVDITGARFQRCTFTSCRFGDLRLDATTRLDGTVLDDCAFTSMEFSGGATVFSPSEIQKELARIGAKVITATNAVDNTGPRIHPGAIQCVERFLRASERTCDVAIEDLEEESDEASTVANIGLRTGIFRGVSKPTSGPKRTFIRFKIDRERLLSGQLSNSGDAMIDEFWNELAKKYPA